MARLIILQNFLFILIGTWEKISRHRASNPYQPNVYSFIYTLISSWLWKVRKHPRSAQFWPFGLDAETRCQLIFFLKPSCDINVNENLQGNSFSDAKFLLYWSVMWSLTCDLYVEKNVLQWKTIAFIIN